MLFKVFDKVIGEYVDNGWHLGKDKCFAGFLIDKDGVLWEAHPFGNLESDTKRFQVEFIK